MPDPMLRDLGVSLEDATPIPDFDHLVSRAHRHVAVRRAGSMAAMGCMVVAAVLTVARVDDADRRSSPLPADRVEHDSTPWCFKDRRPACFDIDGWIVYGERASGLWAVNPSGSGGPDNLVQLRDERWETPLEWSRDGTMLLVRRSVPRTPGDAAGGLYVLSAAGTETQVVRGDGYALDGSFSPDGSQVIYAWYGSGGIHIVDSGGGTARLLRAPESRPYPGEDQEFLGELYNPVFSPDGTQIAYFDGMGDWGHSLRVMRSDGTDVRVLWSRGNAGHIDDLAWSPDGRRLLFAFQQGEDGIWTVGVDGAGLNQVASAGVSPAWSPDGTHISYRTEETGPLRITDLAGEHVTEFDHGGSGAWNPLPLDQ